ncbi:MAG TPA: glycoside hydrolase N-terminal domain-containing protein [bacterium]|nr:glycoside hydrolase N-terminal domain-containing protein [bacterium]HNS49331.1 glycoside hydrolase N-terminal domain-containing protein [bacterium]
MSSLIWAAGPAGDWQEGYPIGNGRLAGLVLGGVGSERVLLNHEWLWRGRNRFKDNEPKEPARLAEIRRLFFEGKVLEAGDRANDYLGGAGGTARKTRGLNRVDPYQPLGDLRLDFDGGEAAEYRRQLDLAAGLVTVCGRTGAGEVRREFLAHACHPVIAVRISGAPAVGFRLRLERSADPDCRLEAWTEPAACGFRGRFSEGLSFAVEARLHLPGGGRCRPLPEGGLEVEAAPEAVILLAAAVSPEGGDPAPECRKGFEGVPAGWPELLRTHREEHGRRYGRVGLELAGRDFSERPTPERLRFLANGHEDNDLYALFFNYGRYLLIASSWGAELPANLQGKWNPLLAPPWECDYHFDINIQMNYWLAEAGNLSECTAPLFDLVDRFRPHGRQAARQLYGCGGVWLPIQTDCWGRATPESYGHDVWVGAAAWIAQHFWWHYQYTLDRKFLRERAYPFLKEAAAFFEDYLAADPQGRLVPVPSQSPENQFEGGSWPVSLGAAATMDLQLITELLNECLAASRILGVDGAKRARWRAILKRLPPPKIGRWGQLQEWLEDYNELQPGHRHISHLFGLYPAALITPEDTPELAAAARRTLERRLASGGGYCGWSSALVAACFSRLGEGERALQALTVLLSKFVTPSLLGLHPPHYFQIDANLGGAAAVAEMLLQSHGGRLRVLPACPTAWWTGRVRGLVGRGGFTVDIEWREGRLEGLRVHSRFGGTCRLRLPRPARIEVRCGKRLVRRFRKAALEAAWKTAAGRDYELKITEAEIEEGSQFGRDLRYHHG